MGGGIGREMQESQKGIQVKLCDKGTKITIQRGEEDGEIKQLGGRSLTLRRRGRRLVR